MHPLDGVKKQVNYDTEKRIRDGAAYVNKKPQGMQTSYQIQAVPSTF
jgi:hypothetical protein